MRIIGVEHRQVFVHMNGVTRLSIIRSSQTEDPLTLRAIMMTRCALREVLKLT